MSRKIQEFFKAISQATASETTKDKKIHQGKAKIDSQQSRVTLDKKMINTNADLREKRKNLSCKCRFCEKELSSSSNLYTHMLNIHSKQFKGLLECLICQQKFIENHKLEQHMKIKHFDGKIQLFECDFCGKTSKTKGNMKILMNIHLPTVNCDICSVELKQSSMNFHMKETHAEDQKFQCKLCPKTFKTRKYLKLHEKVHDKKFQCTACMRNFAKKFQLLKHQKEVHENPGSYSCEVCGKKFNQEKNLRRHLKIHDRYRSKRFKCNRCNYATDENTDYKSHQKSHARRDERFAAMKNPLKCPKCSSLCRDKQALRKHLKNVHLDEPYQCDLCGRYLKVLFCLKKHLKLHQQLTHN